MKPIDLFAVVAFASAAQTASAVEFSKLITSGSGPSERSSPAVAAVGNSAYVFGGVFDDFSTGVDTFYDDLFRFDTVTNAWTQLSPIGPVPHARAFAASVSDTKRSRILIFGGAHYGPFFSDFVAFDDLWAYTPATNAWTQIIAGNAGPFGRSRPTMWIDGDRLYVFAGINSFFQTMNDLWVLDLASNLWTELIPDGAAGSPPSRHEGMSGEHPRKGKLTVYGGEGFDFSIGFTVLGDTWEYDIASNTWTNVTPAPANDIQPPRNYAASGVIGSQLYLQGGDSPGGSAGCGAPFEQNPTHEVWQFHLKQHRWKQVTPSGDPLPRLKRQRSTVVDGVMYIFTGWDFVCPGPGQVWNLDVFTLEP